MFGKLGLEMLTGHSQTSSGGCCRSGPLRTFGSTARGRCTRKMGVQSIEGLHLGGVGGSTGTTGNYFNVVILSKRR